MNVHSTKKTIDKYDFIKCESYFNERKKNNYQFRYLINELEKLGDIILIGGAIRDIVLSQCEPRDIDLIIDTQEDIDGIMNTFDNTCRNRLGGYKISLDDLEIDVWTLDNHWAFKEKILDKSFNNIMYSTFLNFDSLFYNFSKRIGCAHVFNEAVSTSCLDITLKDEYINRNPTKDVNIVRMFIIEDSWNLKFSKKARTYIQQWVIEQENPVETLWKAQKKHYRNKWKICPKRLEEKLRDYATDNI